MTFNLRGLAPLRRCHEPLSLSAILSESTVSSRWRLGTPAAQRTGVRTWGDVPQLHLHSPSSLLTLFFWRWPMKCHLMSGHEPKIWGGQTEGRRGGGGGGATEAWTYLGVRSLLQQLVDLQTDRR